MRGLEIEMTYYKNTLIASHHMRGLETGWNPSAESPKASHHMRGLEIISDNNTIF